MISVTPRIPRCSECGVTLSGARVVVRSQWWCPDCAYKREHPDAEMRKPVQTRGKRKPQEETLFPLPPARRS